MSEKQKAVVSLTLVLETCSQAVTALNAASLDHEQSEPIAVLLPVLHKDLISLLSLTYNATTKISIALKPSAPTWSASLTPLKDLSSHIAALAHCVALFNSAVYGATLKEVVVAAIVDVFNSVAKLVGVFLGAANGNGDDADAEEYLMRTGVVHDSIERAKTLARDNSEAVRTQWEADLGGLEDAFREVGDMVEDQGQDSGNAEEEPKLDDDDGWDGLGFDSGKKMNKDELDRTKKVHGLLRYTTLLHKQILTLLSPTSYPHPPNALLDKLPPLSTTILTTTDNLASSLYPPHDLPSISAELDLWLQNIRVLEGVLAEFWLLTSDLSLQEQLGRLTVTGGVSGKESKTKKKGRKWFETCFARISTTAAELARGLAIPA